jgi:Cytochrome c554 and c-prime
VNRPTLLLLALSLVPAIVCAGDYIGAETCKACHPAAYEAWRRGPHARALEGLPEARRKDPTCTACHAPALEQGVAGVACEACHGPGRVYAQAYVMRDRELARAVGLLQPGERSCATCHTETTPSLGRFDHARKLPLIDHWTADREARRR